jgi:cyclohexanone monooxygenase
MNKDQASVLDAVIVGAGFGGIYMLHRLRDKLGLKVKVLEKAAGVAGTWYHNRYPGARTDSYWFTYCYSFDEQLLQEWDWTLRYPIQREVKAYLEHVVDRYRLADDIQLDTNVVSSHFDARSDAWTVSTDRGEKFTAKYFITASGVLHAEMLPNIRGLGSFKGPAHHTSAWPEGLDLSGKRVGVLGTGSTGVQVIPEIAPEVDQLFVFHRTPQYVVPAVQYEIPESEKRLVKSNYRKLWENMYASATAFGFDEATEGVLSVSPEERERRFQYAWDYGGPFYFQIGTFNDITANADANEAAAEFIRRKIQEIVKDPALARTLTPTEPYARRPLCGSNYYETFNRKNVTLVDVKANPIEQITPSGVRLKDGTEHDLDVLVLATGFDGFTGSYLRMDIRGRGGKTLQQHWGRGGTSYLGISNAGFPNMFTIFGPYGPFGNNPPIISTEVEFISEIIDQAQRGGCATVEATQEAESGWVDMCDELVEDTLMLSVDSWITGGNVPGKRKQLMLYLGGIADYRARLARIAAEGYAGFSFQDPIEFKQGAADG